MNGQYKFVVNLFLLSLLVICIDIAGLFLGWKFVHGLLFRSILVVLPVFVIISHAMSTLGKIRGISFLFFASSIGFFAEFIGIHYGIPFGRYVYNSNQYTLFTVPILVIAYWAVFIYLGYAITNSFLYWLGMVKPSRAFHNSKNVVLLMLMDGFIVTCIDLFLDPIAVKQNTWRWLDTGPYFGIPISNFIGWFVVTIVATGIFRLFEYYHPKIVTLGVILYTLPSIGYGLIWLLYTIIAFRVHAQDVIIIGTILMVPIVVSSILLSRRQILLLNKR